MAEKADGRGGREPLDMEGASQNNAKHAGEETGKETYESALDLVPKDTGWAWFCVLAGFVMNLLVVGAAAKSFGILFVEFIEKFQGTNAATSWIVALSQCLALMLGPIASALASKFTSRRVVFAGGLVCCAGFILSCYAVSLKFLYFSYGILVGVGSALAYAPSIITVGQYFEKRRALANGITVAGSGVGNFVIPPLMRVLLDHYGLQGAMLILAGLMLNVCVCGALLRPIDFYSKYSRKEPGPVNTMQDTLVKDGDCQNIALDEDVVCDQLGNVTKSGPHNLKNHIQEDSNIEICACDSVNGENVKLEELDLQPITDTLLDPPQSIPRPTDSSVTDLRKSPLFKCCPVKRKAGNKEQPKFNWRLLKNPVFLLYAFSVFFAFCGYPQLFFIVPPHAMQLNVSKKDAAFLVSIIGITDLIGRIGFGWLADLNMVKKKHIFIVSMAVAGISCFFIPMLDGFASMAAFCAIIGLFAGAFIALIAVILAESLGVHQLHSAFGLVVLFMGTSFLFAPATAGWLKDVTGHWRASFIFCGASMLIGSLFPLLEPLALRYEQRKEHGTTC